jgi:hypothetical protein
MKKVLKKMIATAALGTLCMAASAQATMLLDFGFGTDVGVLDWSPGTAISIGGSSQAALLGGQSVPLLFQAKLGNFLDANGNAIGGTGLGTSYEVTVTMMFYEFVNVSTPGGPATFTLDLSKPSSVNIYKDTTIDSNNLTGAGFADGVNVLSGHAIATGFVSNFASINSLSSAPTSAFANLDSSPNGNQWGGQKSVNGAGGTDLNVKVDSYDNTFIIDPIIDLLYFELLSNTSNNLPYNQVDPSRQMFNGYVTTANLGAINGHLPIWTGVPFARGGDDVMFQSDANSSFAQPVPEPSTFALTGLGLLLAGGLMRRRRS